MSSNGRRRRTRSLATADLSLLPKKRGQPPKTTSPTGSHTTSSETATKDKQPLFAGNGDSSCDEDQPPTKKSKTDNCDDGAASSQQSGKRGNKKVIPWSPRPVRSNRVLHPGAPDMKNARRTSAQVVADNKRKEGLKRDLDALAQRQIEILAQMEISQEMADEADDQDAIRTLADVEDNQDIEDSDFVMAEMASDISSFEGDTDVDGGDTEMPARKKIPAVSAVCRFSTSITETENNA
jgi:hypothetical protein